MFSNVGWAEILVIMVVAVIVLGPERLPDAAHSLGKGLRQLRDWVNDAQGHIKETVDTDLGDLKDLREPVKELAKIRAMGPKAAAVHYLLDDDDSLLDVDLGLPDLDVDLGLPDLNKMNLKDLVLGNDEDEKTYSDNSAEKPAAAAQRPAAGVPVTVGDSWAEASDDEVEITFDDQDESVD